MGAVRKAYTSLFFVGVFFLPFNSHEGFPFLGEFSRESAFLFFTLGLVLYALEAVHVNRIVFPLKSEVFTLLMAFVVYCMVSTFLNGYSVYHNYFKYTSGINRFIRQYLVLTILSVFFLLYFYKVFLIYELKEIFLKMRKVFSITFFIMIVYSSIEVLILVFGLTGFESVIKLFEFMPFLEVRLDTTFGRISSVSFEPPFLAVYLITIAPWMFSYMMTSKGFKRFTPTLAVLLMTFLSGSRTGLIVVLFQFILFLILLLDTKEFRRYFVYLLGVVLVGVLSLIIVTKGEIIIVAKEKIETLNFKENLTKSVSNKSRFGMQYANFMVFKDNPIFGVGFGQQAYHNRKYYPDWATKDNYEFKLWYLNEDEPSFPPGYNLYIRLLAETGIVGFSLFTLILVLIMLKLFGYVKIRGKDIKIYSIILIISFVGFLLNWLQIDTFRIFGFWLCVVLFLRLQKNLKENKTV